MSAPAIVLFGLISAMAWGIADFFVGKVAQTLGSVKASFLVNTCGALIYSLVYFLFLGAGTVYTNDGIMYALVGSIFFGAAQAAFFKAMALGPVGLVSSISSTYPLVALIIGLMWFAATTTTVDVIGIVLIVGGVMAASGLFEKTRQRLGKGPFIALLPALGWGAGVWFLSQALALMDWQGVLLIELLAAPLVLLMLLPFIKGKERVSAHQLLVGAKQPQVWVAGILQMVGLLAFNIGIAMNVKEAAVVVAISSCYPVLTIFLALRHLQEKVPLVPLVGGVVGVIGVVVLALG